MMLLNTTVQHRVKHFDLLLSRELEFIKRQYEQNLIIHKNLEKSILHDTIRLQDSNQKKVSLRFGEDYQEQTKQCLHYKMDKSTDMNIGNSSCLSISTINDSQYQNDETIIQSSTRFRRQCTKIHRLPPIIKSNILKQVKQPAHNLHWIDHFQKTNRTKETVHETFLQMNDESSKETLPKLTSMEKQIHSFIESLPIYTGIQRGFDNFAPSSLYSNRPPVIMK